MYEIASLLALYKKKEEREGKGEESKGRDYLRAPLVDLPSRLVLILLGRAVGVLLHVYAVHRLSFRPSFATLLMLLLLPARRRRPPP